MPTNANVRRVVYLSPAVDAWLQEMRAERGETYTAAVNRLLYDSMERQQHHATGWPANMLRCLLDPNCEGRGGTDPVPVLLQAIEATHGFEERSRVVERLVENAYDGRGMMGLVEDYPEALRLMRARDERAAPE